MITVRLDPLEIRLATWIGKIRNSNADKKDLPPRPGVEIPDPVAKHILGARGEIAVSRCLNLYWSGMAVLEDIHGANDVGWLVEVKTRTEDWHQLGLRKKEKPGTPAVLTVSDLDRDTVDVMGWAWSHEVKRAENWHADHHCFYCPPNELRSLDELEDWVLTQRANLSCDSHPNGQARAASA